MRFSILLPTYNRKNKLKVVLDALFGQDEIQKGEIIVGVDGSEDGTVEFLETASKRFAGKMSFFRISNSGRAVIRNRLMEQARGDILIFVQDDIVVTEGWLKAHLAFHCQTRGALVGHITWYPKQHISAYMRWLEKGGHMLDFSGYADGDQMDFWHFYMGNISLRREQLGGLRFDESMKTYGWEDIMMGYEFVRQGAEVYYSRGALAYHWDEYEEKDLKEYMFKVGKSAVLAERKYAGVGFVPSFWKRYVFQVMILMSDVFWFAMPQPWKWYVNMKRWFLQAVADSSL